MNQENTISSRLAGEAADASMIGRMRLVLSISALLTIFIDPGSVGQVSRIVWLIFFIYAAHATVLYILSQLERPFRQSKVVHWLDLCWYALIVFCTGDSDSYFFLLFFFSILTASFRWGFEEGSRVAIASSILFAVTGLASLTEAELSRLLLRSILILALGYMIAYWGESEVAQKRRLALLRDVSRLSNPRFGVNHTIASVLEKTRAFFNVDSCILVMQDNESGAWSMRTAMAGDAGRALKTERISAEAAAPLMAFQEDQIAVYTRPSWLARRWTDGCQTHGHTQTRWTRHGGEAGETLGELLEAHSFISAPLSLRRHTGRIYVISRENGFHKTDALFLSHISAQAFPVIENIELLDRLASDAAARERQKISRDLHDTTIQPYIGLKHGLHAVRNKASADNPLIPDLDKLTEITTQVIGELRRFAGTFKTGLTQGESVFLTALRRQAAQIAEFYGIDITISAEGELDMSDRLAAEVFQVVNEGLSNIRKHTSAQRGLIKLKCEDGQLNIRIENECRAGQTVNFMPRSIAERAAALGGRVQVESQPGGSTTVQVEIPV